MNIFSGQPGKGKGLGELTATMGRVVAIVLAISSDFSAEGSLYGMTETKSVIGAKNNFRWIANTKISSPHILL